MDRLNYSAEEEERVARALRSEEAPVCPRCGGAMTARDVPPPTAVSYVRDRLWLTCGGCGRSLVLDRRRTRASDAGKG